MNTTKCLQTFHVFHQILNDYLTLLQSSTDVSIKELRSQFTQIDTRIKRFRYEIETWNLPKKDAFEQVLAGIDATDLAQNGNPFDEWHQYSAVNGNVCGIVNAHSKRRLPVVNGKVIDLSFDLGDGVSRQVADVHNLVITESSWMSDFVFVSNDLKGGQTQFFQKDGFIYKFVDHDGNVLELDDAMGVMDADGVYVGFVYDPGVWRYMRVTAAIDETKHQLRLLSSKEEPSTPLGFRFASVYNGHLCGLVGDGSKNELPFIDTVVKSIEINGKKEKIVDFEEYECIDGNYNGVTHVGSGKYPVIEGKAITSLPLHGKLVPIDGAIHIRNVNGLCNGTVCIKETGEWLPVVDGEIMTHIEVDGEMRPINNAEVAVYGGLICGTLSIGTNATVPVVNGVVREYFEVNGERKKIKDAKIQVIDGTMNGMLQFEGDKKYHTIILDKLID